MNEADSRDHSRRLTVTVHNEDNGEVATIEAAPEAMVSTVIAEMYTKFGLERKQGDRLRCESTGGDVFEHAAEPLSAYEHTHCHDLVWLFAADQGGA